MRLAHSFVWFLLGTQLGSLAGAQPAALERAGVPAPAQGGLTLAQATARFDRENLKLVAARYQVSAARAEVIAAGLWQNPHAEFGSNLRVHGAPQGADREYSVQLTQTLPIWGRLSASRQAAELNASALESEFAAAAWIQLGELRRAYLALQLAQAQRAVLTAGLTDLERVQRVLEVRAAAGANPAYDRARLDVERGNLRARLAEVELQLSAARADLAAAIGGEPSLTEVWASDALAEPSRESRHLAALVRQALEQRHEVQANRLSASAAAARERAARRRILPEPELGIGYSRWSGVPGYSSSTVGGALLVSAAIPLPLLDHGQGTLARHENEQKAAHVREHDARNSVKREVEHALRDVELSAQAYLAYHAEAKEQAEAVRRTAEVIYKEGRGTILELLDAYSSYLRVEEQDLALRGRALSAALTLTQAIGPGL